MATKLKCPNCNHEFPLEAALNDELNALLENTKNEYRNQMNVFLKSKEEEYNKKEAAWREQQFAQRRQWEEELKEKNKALEESIRKSLAGDFENQIRLLKESAQENEEKLKTARAKELEYLQKEKALLDKEAELELKLQKQLMEEREKLADAIQKNQQEKFAQKETEYLLKQRELEKQLEDQKKLAAEMKRKAEQGSMQLQGEAQELLLQELLQNTFPFDVIEEIGKGVRGADCIQIVRNNVGQECGKIYYESKRAENFGGDWIEKLKSDMRKLGADIAVLVTRRYPKDMEQFGEKDGVWICSFSEARALATVLRDGIIRVYNANKNQENRADKMTLIYDYVTSNEFSEQLKAIREGFMSMKTAIQKERDAMERIWKAREKQIEKILLNATHIRGTIDGISGLAIENEPDYLDFDEEEN